MELETQYKDIHYRYMCENSVIIQAPITPNYIQHFFYVERWLFKMVSIGSEPFVHCFCAPSASHFMECLPNVMRSSTKSVNTVIA